MKEGKNSGNKVQPDPLLFRPAFSLSARAGLAQKPGLARASGRRAEQPPLGVAGGNGAGLGGSPVTE